MASVLPMYSTAFFKNIKSISRKPMITLHLIQSNPLTFPVLWQWSTTSKGFLQILHTPFCSRCSFKKHLLDRLYFCIIRRCLQSGTHFLHHTCLAESCLNGFLQCLHVLFFLDRPFPSFPDWLLKAKIHFLLPQLLAA